MLENVERCPLCPLLSCRALLEMMSTTEKDATAQLVDILGPLPEECWGRWPGWGKVFYPVWGGGEGGGGEVGVGDGDAV